VTELLVSVAILAVIAVMAAGGRDTSDSRDSSPAPTFSSKGPAVTTTPNYQLWANAALYKPADAVVSTDTFISKWRATLSSSS